MTLIFIAIAVVVAVGLVAACILSYASKVFYVPVDERVAALSKALPGANCGGCGFAGCDDYANALVEDESLAVTKCPVGGADVAAQLGEILGKSAEAGEKKVAVVMCNGTKDAVKTLYEYKDIKTCSAAKSVFGGMNACPFGCMGLGDCVVACDFDAIRVINGVAMVNKEKCVACGACEKACPNGLIRISPESNKVIVKCHNTEKGGVARKECDNACIGCMKCVKVCKFDSIKVEDNLAYIDPETCKNCGLCAKECPTGAIHNTKTKKKAAPKKSPEEIEALKKAAAEKKAKAAAAAEETKPAEAEAETKPAKAEAETKPAEVEAPDKEEPKAEKPAEDTSAKDEAETAADSSETEAPAEEAEAPAETEVPDKEETRAEKPAEDTSAKDKPAAKSGASDKGGKPWKTLSSKRYKGKHSAGSRKKSTKSRVRDKK